jgi:predicted flap endonuclease-1-like 5' DNA nuclease
MLYTMGEIILSLILAGGFGFLIGWLLRGLSLRRRMEAQYETEIAHRQARLKEVETDLRDTRERADALETEVAGMTADLRERKDSGSTLEARLAEAETASLDLSVQMEQLRSDLAERDEKISGLEAGLDAAPPVDALNALEDQVAGLRGESEAKDAEIARLADQIEQLESEETTAPGAETVVAELEKAVDGLRDDVSDRDVRIKELEGELGIEREPLRTDKPDSDSARAAVEEIAQRTAGSESVPDDDLKRIYGVGPKIEGLLKEMGITSFRQIAGFADTDIDAVAAALGSFPDRIRRDDWMSGAAAAHEKKYGSAP